MRIPSPTGASHGGFGGLKKARIEIIPLIDIIFFLLATFVMVSLSMVKNQGISLNLPVAKTSEPQDRKNYLSISVGKSGEYFVDKEAVSFENLSTVIGRIRSERMSSGAGDLKIFINGDTDSRFGDAVKVLDEVRRLGITKIAIETLKSEERK